jgi:hypothetical protein
MCPRDLYYEKLIELCVSENLEKGLIGFGYAREIKTYELRMSLISASFPRLLEKFPKIIC